MEDRNKINEILKNIGESTNKELKICLDFLNEDFEQTKLSIIKLTKHLDNTEILYNKVLKEYEKRIK
jgi:transcriptional regulator of heat shock response